MHFPPMTKLNTWMDANRRDDRWLASVIDCDRSQASRIRRGRSRPSPARAFQIERLTKGKVKAADLLTAPLCPANDTEDPEVRQRAA